MQNRIENIVFTEKALIKIKGRQYILSGILNKKPVIRLFIFSVILLLFFPTYQIQAKSSDWDQNWSYSNEIILPIDTSIEEARYQPVDFHYEFDHPCWAINENEHSIRICCWDGGTWHELESQIYQLETIDDDTISSCNIVFLVPEFADGSEEYYLYYDDSETPLPDYPDHINYEESFFRYEPISGYPLESDYYKVIDDNCIKYAISFNGQFMGYNICQHIMKMKNGVTEVVPNNIELFAAFDFKYTYETSLFGYSSTSQKVLSKEVLTDGNLMLEVCIVSTSKYNDLKTTATYKYYHNPSLNSRIHVHVKHETLEEITPTADLPASNTDGVFASLQAGGVTSRSIEDLNIGQILPFLHYYNEFGTISEYDVDIDPEYNPDHPDIRIIGYKDDVDLGSYPWISFDEGKTGFAHSVIFDSNQVLVSGSDEKDGLQINAFEVDYPHLPGLENNVATIQIGRNSYEPGENHDLIIPSDFVVEFDAEFFTTENDGYPIIETESIIFQDLVSIKPQSTEGINDDVEELITHDLSVIVHNAFAFPFGSSLSVALGLNLSYVNVELYKDNEYIYSENAVKLPLNALEEMEDPSLMDKIRSSLGIFDLRNISFFKKAMFSRINEGKYVVKVFKENQFLKGDKQFIGYAIVDLQSDEKIHVFCRPEASILVSVVDQHNNEIENVEVTLQKEDTIISSGLTDEQGQVIIKAPVNADAYDLIIYYQGLEVYQNSMKLGFLQHFFQPSASVEIDLHSLHVHVVDTWGDPPEIQLNPTLSDESELFKMSGEEIDFGEIEFLNIIPGSYQLTLSFKSFTVTENIDIDGDESLDLEFPATYDVDLKIINARGEVEKDSQMIISRNDDDISIDTIDSSAFLSVPPGEYLVKVYQDDDLVSERTIGVYGAQKYDLITTNQPSYVLIVIILSVLFILASLIVFGYKKQLRLLVVTIGIILIILSLFLSWWGIQGSTEHLETSTNLYLIPSNMITITSTEQTIAGELSYLPPIVLTAITGMIALAMVGCVMIAAHIYVGKKGMRRLDRISLILGSLSILGPWLIFLVAINELSSITIGGIFGSGLLDVGVAGETQIYSVSSFWGPAHGFYIYAIGLVLIFSAFVSTMNQKRKEEGKKEKGFDFQHPLFGMSFKKWFYVLQKNGGVDNKYLNRGLFIGFFSLFFALARYLFKVKFAEKIAHSEIKNPPVFILGHWRSGTTYLHELLSEDPQFCYVTLWHTMLPDSYPLLEPMKHFMAKFLPSTRPMDNMAVDIDGPYEEEAGIAVLSPWSFFHAFHFPKNAEEQYEKSIHYTGLSEIEKEEWDRSYFDFMKTVSYTNKGKRLLIKDPANTARIPTLLQLFPDAKFIHIKRNPYKVYLSMVKMRNNVPRKLALQKYDKEVIEQQVINDYKRLMTAFFEQKKMIPLDNYVEISYEELVKNPLEQVKKIYKKLKLSGLEKGLPGMNRYLESKKDYKVNVYKIDEKVVQRVQEQWDVTIKPWGYEPP